MPHHVVVLLQLARSHGEACRPEHVARFPHEGEAAAELLRRGGQIEIAHVDAALGQPRDAQNWKGPYLKEIPKDPWNNEYIYECPGKNNPTSYDLMSMGPDGRSGSEDDITNWQQAGQKR